MHGNLEILIVDCGKYNTEVKIGTLLCRPKRVTYNDLRQDDYIHRVGMCIGVSGGGVGEAGRWKVDGRC